MAKDKTKNKNKISDYNLASILLDIVMLFLGLIFFIGTLAGKGDEIASGFVRVVGGVLILVGIFELINFLRQLSSMLFLTGTLSMSSSRLAFPLMLSRYSTSFPRASSSSSS